MWITQGRNRRGTLAPGGWISRVPTMPIGTMGAPVRKDNRAGPVWPLRSLPSRLRVPSG
jgi:hypothetical protein